MLNDHLGASADDIYIKAQLSYDINIEASLKKNKSTLANCARAPTRAYFII